MDEESHHKHLYQEDKRLVYMRRYDRIGLDALIDFEKCLDAWPNQGFEEQL